MFNRKNMIPSDFIRIRDFLVRTRGDYPEIHNWDIDRWEFCRSVSHAMNDTYDSWMETVGLWENKDGEIVAVVNSEGEGHGEAFFQLDKIDYSIEFINEMIDYAEKNLAVIEKNEKGNKEKKKLTFRVQQPLSKVINCLNARGYKKGDWKEINTVMTTDRAFDYQLPKGYRIADGHITDGDMRAKCHSLAFGYTEGELIKKAAKGFDRMKAMPDYMEFLDISVLDTNNEVAAFATLWWDETNEQGILEPVGTSKHHRKKGLAKAAIYEAINRVKEKGCKVICVGSDQPFYKSIGFDFDFELDIYEKEWEED